jgi:hypothetical protein
MVEAFIILLFVTALVLTWKCVASINLSHLRVEDGVLIGLTFYIVCPGIFLLYIGEMKNYELKAASFRPFEDVVTSANILIGWITVLLYHTVHRRLYVPPVPAGTRPLYEYRHVDLILFFAMYLVLTVVTFRMSGRAEGGHWAETLGEGFSNSTALILIANFANVYRTAIFGFLVFAYSRGALRPTYTLAIGATVVGVDFFLTFNRITAVYFIIMTLLIYRRYFWMLCLGFAVIAPIIGYVSSVWAVFRAFALRSGYNLEGLASAFEIASQITESGGEQPFDKLLNSLFETSNILVFNYVSNNINDAFPVLWGQTFIGRPLTFLIPSTIWPDKPRVFANVLGEYIQAMPGLALNSTLFGEALANFHYFWPLALFSMLTLISAIYRKLTRISPVIGFLGCFVAIALWRFDIAFAFVSLVALGTFEVARRVTRVLVRVRKPASGTAPLTSWAAPPGWRREP